MKVVGHRANHARRITFYLKNKVNFIELDIKVQNGKFIVYHGSPLYSSTTLTEALIKKALDQMLARDNIISPLSVDDAIDLIYKFEDYRVGLWLDLKSDVNVNTIISFLSEKSLVGSRDLVISSANYNLLFKLKNVFGDSVKTAASISFRPVDSEMLSYIVHRISCDILSIEASIFNSWFKSEASKLNLEVAVWVINSPSSASKLAELRPDYVITDRPDLVAPVLRSIEK